MCVCFGPMKMAATWVIEMITAKIMIEITIAITLMMGLSKLLVQYNYYSTYYVLYLFYLVQIILHHMFVHVNFCRVAVNKSHR